MYRSEASLEICAHHSCRRATFPTPRHGRIHSISGPGHTSIGQTLGSYGRSLLHWRLSVDACPTTALPTSRQNTSSRARMLCGGSRSFGSCPCAMVKESSSWATSLIRLLRQSRCAPSEDGVYHSFGSRGIMKPEGGARRALRSSARPNGGRSDDPQKGARLPRRRPSERTSVFAWRFGPRVNDRRRDPTRTDASDPPWR